MARLESLVMAIDALSEKPYGQFHRWFFERDSAKWDQEIEAAAGRLDFLNREVQEANAKGTVKKL